MSKRQQSAKPAEPGLHFARLPLSSGKSSLKPLKAKSEKVKTKNYNSKLETFEFYAMFLRFSLYVLRFLTMAYS